MPTRRPMESFVSTRPRGVLLAMFLFVSFWRFLEATEGCVKLPRIQVQFLCKENLLKEGFNATRVFEDFYDTKIAFQNDGYYPETNQTIPNDLQLYISVGINTASDVSPNEWYYQRCDLESNKTLVTMDIRGYNRLDYSKVRLDSDESNFADYWNYHPTPFSLDDLQSYLSSKVCNGNSFAYYHDMIKEWDDDLYPIPAFGDWKEACGTRQSHSFDADAIPVRGGGQVVYPSSSILRYDGLPSNNSQPKDAYEKRYWLKQEEGGYVYNHDLHQLCMDRSELNMVGYDSDQQMVSPFFWMFGVMVGYIMVFTIKAEFTRPLRYQQLPSRSGSHNRNSTNSHETSDVNDDDNDNDHESHGRSSQRHGGEEIELVMI